MRDQHEMRWGKANWITGAILLGVYLLLRLLAPALSARTSLLIALLAATVSSVVIVILRQKKQERDEENKLPPL